MVCTVAGLCRARALDGVHRTSPLSPSIDDFSRCFRSPRCVILIWFLTKRKCLQREGMTPALLHARGNRRSWHVAVHGGVREHDKAAFYELNNDISTIKRSTQLLRREQSSGKSPLLISSLPVKLTRLSSSLLRAQTLTGDAAPL